MLLTTTPSERIGRYIRMRGFFVRSNRSESFVHTRSSVGFAIITSGFDCSVHTGSHLALRVPGQVWRRESSNSRRQIARIDGRGVQIVLEVAARWWPANRA